MISWITSQLAIADLTDMLHHAYDTVTVIVDARSYFGYLNRDDELGNIRDAVSLITRNIRELERKVIVFCDAGMDRSPFIVAKTLCELEHIDLNDAYTLIKKKRPCVQEHYEWDIR